MQCLYSFQSLLKFAAIVRKWKISIHFPAGLRRDIHLCRLPVRGKRVHPAVSRVRPEHEIRGERVVERRLSHR